MTLRIGVIADDFTGATDIAGFLVAAGLRTVQLNGATDADAIPPHIDADAVVISLKSRSMAPQAAVAASLGALDTLTALGAEHFLFKYCSTFDSTPAGNIGPVTDALIKQLGLDFTVIAPALPVNGRTVYQGNLFVNGVPLAESGMRNHPVTPMTDANVVRLMDAQSEGTAAVVPFDVVERGVDAVRQALDETRAAGVRYAVLDALTMEHLDVLGRAVQGMRLITGGSGIGFGLARALVGDTPAASNTWTPAPGRTVAISGSASQATNEQVANYRALAPSHAVDVPRVIDDAEAYRDEIITEILAVSPSAPAPLVYATAPTQTVAALQQQHGAQRLSAAIEDFLASLATALHARGVARFIVAGGETSGAVTQALGVSGFEIGPQIAPGVPWTRSLDGQIELALKSGNFGDPHFFRTAQSVVGLLPS